MKKKCLLLIILINVSFLYSEIKFNPVSLTKDNSYLFNSLENIGNNQITKTLFWGNLIGETAKFEAMSFFPEDLYSFPQNNKFFIQNRIGLYSYDLSKNIISPVRNFPNFAEKAEFVIHRLQKSSISPNTKYVVGKIPVSPTTSSIYLYDMDTNSYNEVVKDVETTPGIQTGLWSNDSNYFIYQKNNNLYYFSVSDFKNKKLLTEEWRWIGKINLINSFWTKDNYFIWIENNLIYRADPNQFFYRSIYKNYLRLGDIIGKIPFIIDTAFDSFVYNDSSKKFIVAKDGSSIYYYSLTNDLKQNPYLQLNDNMRFESSILFDSGEGILSVKILSDGKINKKIVLIKKINNEFQFITFDNEFLKDAQIYGVSNNLNETQFVVNSSKGAYCFDFVSLKLLWKFESEKVISSISINDKWIIGGLFTTFLVDGNSNQFKPIFASSVDETGFVDPDKNIAVILAGKSYFIDKKTKIITPSNFSKTDLIHEEKNNKYRLLSREIKKGFYQEGIYLKDLYSGNQIEVTGVPNLLYKLYQPEITLGSQYYYSPDPAKYEVSLVFNCSTTAEGIFPILTSLSQFQIPATFFINGNFMDINSRITYEISNFNFEIGNMFQYNVNLTSTNLLVDKNFIRQGLSSNEEKYYNITGKNFSPYWHSPYYSFNENIVKYGLENGYKFVSYQLDSLDWVSENDREMDTRFTMNNSQLIARILNNLKPGQIIVFSAGKNYIKRSDWLFNNLDLLISELVRSGYTFTQASDLSEKYRVK